MEANILNDLPLDREGGDCDSPGGYPASNEDCTPAILSESGKSVWVNGELHPIDGNRFHWGKIKKS
jgi:hypothetical protein